MSGPISSCSRTCSFSLSRPQEHRTHSFNTRGCSWFREGHAQLLQLIPSRNRGHHFDPRHHVFVSSLFVFELLCPLRSNFLLGGSCTNSSKLSRYTVAHSVVYSCSPRALLTRQRVVPFSSLGIPHSHIRHSSTLRRSLRLTEAFHSPSSIPLFGHSVNPRGCHTLATVGQEGSFLSRVQSRPELVCSEDLVSVQGAADGERKTVSLRGIHKISLEELNHGLNSVVALYVLGSVTNRSHQARSSQQGIPVNL